MLEMKKLTIEDYENTKEPLASLAADRVTPLRTPDGIRVLILTDSGSVDNMNHESVTMFLGNLEV